MGHRLSADAGWVWAGWLRVGEPVRLLDGQTAQVVALRDVAGASDMWDLSVSQLHTFAVGDGAFVVHNCTTTTEDLYNFGPKDHPKGRKPTDMQIDSNGMVTGQHPTAPTDDVEGVSTFTSADDSGLTGHYHRLPMGTELPDGLGVHADGADVGGNAPPGHRTIYATRDMPADEFDYLFNSLRGNTQVRSDELIHGVAG